MAGCCPMHLTHVVEGCSTLHGRSMSRPPNGGFRSTTANRSVTSTDDCSAIAVVGPSRRQRLVWVPQLTMVDQSGRTAALTVAERQYTTLNRQASQIAGWPVVSDKRSLALRFRTAALGMSSQLPFALITGAVGCDGANVESELSQAMPNGSRAC